MWGKWARCKSAAEVWAGNIYLERNVWNVWILTSAVMLSPRQGKYWEHILGVASPLCKHWVNSFFPSLCAWLCPACPQLAVRTILVAFLLDLTECLPSLQGADPPGPGGAAEGAARRGHLHARRIWEGNWCRLSVCSSGAVNTAGLLENSGGWVGPCPFAAGSVRAQCWSCKLY